MPKISNKQALENQLEEAEEHLYELIEDLNEEFERSQKQIKIALLSCFCCSVAAIAMALLAIFL